MALSDLVEYQQTTLTPPVPCSNSNVLPNNHNQTSALNRVQSVPGSSEVAHPPLPANQLNSSLPDELLEDCSSLTHVKGFQTCGTTESKFEASDHRLLADLTADASSKGEPVTLSAISSASTFTFAGSPDRSTFERCPSRCLLELDPDNMLKELDKYLPPDSTQHTKSEDPDSLSVKEFLTSIDMPLNTGDKDAPGTSAYDDKLSIVSKEEASSNDFSTQTVKVLEANRDLAFDLLKGFSTFSFPETLLKNTPLTNFPKNETYKDLFSEKHLNVLFSRHNYELSTDGATLGNGDILELQFIMSEILSKSLSSKPPSHRKGVLDAIEEYIKTKTETCSPKRSRPRHIGEDDGSLRRKSTRPVIKTAAAAAAAAADSSDDNL